MLKKMGRREFLKASAATGALLSMAPHLALAQEPKSIPLSKPQTGSDKSLMQALWKRMSSRQFSPEPLPMELLSNLLWAGFGINRPDGKRTAPTASELAGHRYLRDPCRRRLPFRCQGQSIKIDSARRPARDCRNPGLRQRGARESDLRVRLCKNGGKNDRRCETSIFRFPLRSHCAEHLSLLRFRRIGDHCQGRHRYPGYDKSLEAAARSENHVVAGGGISQKGMTWQRL